MCCQCCKMPDYVAEKSEKSAMLSNVVRCFREEAF